MKKKILIEGMSCEHCVNHVSVALQDIDGVTKVEVNLGGKYAVIDATKDINDEEIKSAIDEAGYEITGIEAL